MAAKARAFRSRELATHLPKIFRRVMDWYYSSGNKTKGPVSAEDFQALVKAGTVARDTLVWREGLTGWQPYGGLLEAGAGLPQADEQMVWCAECDATVLRAEAIPLDGHHVCARCKPAFVQKMREGIALPRLGVWRRGRQVVLSREGRLADRCLYCNAAATHRVACKVRWYPQWIFLLLFCACVPYLLAALFMGRKAVVKVGLCDTHYRIRQWQKYLAGACVVLAIGCGIYGVVFGSAIFLLVFPAIVLWLLFMLSLSLLRAFYMDERFLYLVGAETRFLKSLPKWPERH